MIDDGRDARLPWRLHWIALVLWSVLYFVLFWDTLFQEQRPGFDFSRLGAVLLGMTLLVFAGVGTLVMLFLGRRLATPLVIHGLAIAACGAGIYAEELDRRERAAQRERAAEQERERERQEREREEQARRELAERDRREEEQRAKERQPEGCLHVREVRVQDEKKRLRAEVTFATTCDGAVVVEDLTLVGIDRADGSDVVRRWDGEPVTVPRGETATAAIEDVVQRGGARSIPLASWAWRLDVETKEPRFSRLCFATAGMPGGSDCGKIEAVVAP